MANNCIGRISYLKSASLGTLAPLEVFRNAGSKWSGCLENYAAAKQVCGYAKALSLNIFAVVKCKYSFECFCSRHQPIVIDRNRYSPTRNVVSFKSEDSRCKPVRIRPTIAVGKTQNVAVRCSNRDIARRAGTPFFGEDQSRA